jgi:catechol 2,3-dioxygenase-like lactoylglutathione lyase family enzyme
LQIINGTRVFDRLLKKESNMFTHVMVGSNNFDESKAFYDAALGALGVAPGQAFNGRAFYSQDGGNFGAGGFGVGSPANNQAASSANGGTIGFAAADAAAVDAFHAAGIANGGTCEGAPGLRPNAPGKAYGAYLSDPVGNKICAFCQLPE